MQLGLSMAMGARRRPTAFNPVKHFGSDLLWHFGTPDDWWQAFQRALGPELVANGTFDTSVGWTSLPGGWSVAGGTANNTTSADLIGSVNLTAGRTYLVAYAVTAYTSGIGVGVHNSTGGFVRAAITRRVAVGKYNETLVASATGSASNLVFNSTGPLSIDNVSVREIDLSKIQLWQDPAGTLPVTGPGQTWGLLLDAKDGLARGVELWTPGQVVVANLTETQLINTVVVGKYYQITGAAGLKVNFGPGWSSTLGNFTILKSDGPACRFRNESGAEVTRTPSVREVPGYHASQAGAPSRPLFTCRYNKLQATEDLTNVWWAKTAVVVGPTQMTETVENQGHTVSQYIVPVPAALYTFVCELSPNGRNFALVGFNGGGGGADFLSVNLLTGEATGVVGTPVGSAQLLPSGRVQVTVQVPAVTSEALNVDIRISVDGLWANRVYTGDGVSGINVHATDCRLSIHANTGKPYQRITSATDMDTEGFPFYSLTDGIDDWASTPVIPLGTMGVSEITIATGVTKLSDATTGMLTELSSSVDGSQGTVCVVSPSTLGKYKFGSRGAASPTSDALANAASNAAPHRAVLLGEGDIANDISRLTVNTDTPVLSSADQGTGTYTDQIRYLFRRAGTSLPFGGHWHGDTGIKRLCTDSEKRRLSAYYNRNVKAY